MIRRDERRRWWKIDYGAWLSDPCLRTCSIAARGVWMEVQALASKSAEPGYLVVAGKNPSMRNMARAFGVDPKQLTRCLHELEEKGVLSRDERGVIYSQRMVQDHADYVRDSANGKLSGGNPALRRHAGEDADQGEAEAFDGQDERGATRSTIPEGGQRQSVAATRTLLGSPVRSNNRPLRQKPLNLPLKAESESEVRKNHHHPPRAGEISPGSNVVPLQAPVRQADPPPVAPEQPVEDRAVEMWNAVADRHPGTIKRAGPLFPQRMEMLRGAIKAMGGIEGWEATMIRVEESPLWMGQTARKWEANFDDILKPRNYCRLLEGVHDGLHVAPSARRTAAPRKPSNYDGPMRRLGLLRDEPPANEFAGPTLDHEAMS